jgi:hypothetical protein
MPSLPDTAYVLVGRCLAPSLTDIQRDELARDLARPGIRWEILLAEANRQQATPLWYARLQEHDLLGRLPDDLTAYLAQLHAANNERNRMLRDELVAILTLFNTAGIPVILLKGAATFADQLYADNGARLMADLDLLVPKAQVREAERLLMMKGYVDDPQDRRHLDVWPASARHGHIATLLHLRKKSAVELHYNVAYGQTGRILTVEDATTAAVVGTLRDRAVAWLSPDHRLLHNALHATLPHREFQQGRVRLSDLAEFAALAARYAEDIALERFWSVIRRHGLITTVGVYVLMARLLMRSVVKTRDITETSWHRARLLRDSPAALENADRWKAMRPICWRTVSLIYDRLFLPAWVWRNVCYGDSLTSIPARLNCFTSQLVTRTLHIIRSLVGRIRRKTDEPEDR